MRVVPSRRSAPAKRDGLAYHKADGGVTPKRRPGRDLNPGQKLRRLLGYPLPYRDTRRSAFPLITRLSSLKKDCSPEGRGPLRRRKGSGRYPGVAGVRTILGVFSPQGAAVLVGFTPLLHASARVPLRRSRRARSGNRRARPRRPVCGYPRCRVSRTRPRPRSCLTHGLSRSP